MKINTTIEHDGTTYSAELARVKSTHLGFADRGGFTIATEFHGEGWGQSDGLRSASEGRAEAYIKAVLPVYGVNTWEEVAGRECWALRGNGRGRMGMILGVASKDGSRVVIFSEVMNAHERQATLLASMTQGGN